MKRVSIFGFLLVMLTPSLFAQQPDTTRTDTIQVVQTQAEPEQPSEKRVFTGGTLGVSFGDYFRISIQPMIGLQLNPKAAVGLKVGYEYVEDTRYAQKVTASNYGASVFGEYRIIPQAYGHAEFAYFSYEYSTGNSTSTREWVPFLLLGGGLVQPISKTSSLFVEVLFDVLQDSNSPYDDWQPLISVGVRVGI